MILNKIKTILLSRIKHNKEEQWIERRREICLKCEHNTLNGGSLIGYRFFLATFSSLFSKLMGRAKEDVLGECGLCGCSIFYKSAEKEENCLAGKWETLSDGSLKLDVFAERKEKATINKIQTANRKNYLK